MSLPNNGAIPVGLVANPRRHAITPEQKTATPAQVFDQADEEILMRVHAGILEAQEEATQEGRPKPTHFLQGHSPTKSRTQLLPTMESKRFGHMIFSRPYGFHASFHANNVVQPVFSRSLTLWPAPLLSSCFSLTRSFSLLQGQRMSHLFSFIPCYGLFFTVATVCSGHPCLSQVFYRNKIATR